MLAWVLMMVVVMVIDGWLWSVAGRNVCVVGCMTIMPPLLSLLGLAWPPLPLSKTTQSKHMARMTQD